MGLDMFLERHHKAVEGYLGEDLDEMKETNPKGYALVKPYIVERGEYIKWEDLSEEVGYWRKANAIHKWFVDHVQNGVDDCGTYSVSKEDLRALLAACRLIESGWEMPDKALPTQSGFFFGSTEYDEYYYEDIRNTIDILEKVMAETDFDNYQITYHSSW